MNKQEDYLLTALQMSGLSPDAFLHIINDLVDWSRELNASGTDKRKYSQLATVIGDYWRLRSYYQNNK